MAHKHSHELADPPVEQDQPDQLPDAPPTEPTAATTVAVPGPYAPDAHPGGPPPGMAGSPHPPDESP